MDATTTVPASYGVCVCYLSLCMHTPTHTYAHLHKHNTRAPYMNTHTHTHLSQPGFSEPLQGYLSLQMVVTSLVLKWIPNALLQDPTSDAKRCLSVCLSMHCPVVPCAMLWVDVGGAAIITCCAF